MTHFELHVGSINTGLPQEGLEALGNFIAEHIIRGSRNDIAMTVVNRGLLQDALARGEPASPLQLHQALSVLTGNALQNPVTRLGVILASRYEPADGTFGFMFDLGFRTQEDPNDGAYTKVPRQGCAIFLDSIKAARPVLSDYLAQVKFTAVHEMGHVFNLTHQASPLTFMAPSLATRPYAASAYFFNDDQRAWLAQCSINPNVMPGRSIFRGGQAPFDSVAFRTYRENVGMCLAIELTSREFWPFEPVHLNVLAQPVSADPDEKRRVPAEFDPGYKRFRIVIAGPGEEVRCYRPPIDFCSNGRLLSLSRAKPFMRDIAVFGQAGGYTFSKPGPYRIHVEFELARRTIVRSNDVHFTVKSPGMGSQFRAAEKILGAAGTARALFYREMDAVHLHRLIDGTDDSWPSAMMVRYLCASAAMKRQNFGLARQALTNIVPTALADHQRMRAARFRGTLALVAPVV